LTTTYAGEKANARPFFAGTQARKCLKIKSIRKAVSQNAEKRVENLETMRTVPAFFWPGLCWMKPMKTAVSKVNRSGVYYLMTTVAPRDQAQNARLDTWGIVGFVVVLLGMTGLMRLILTA
jgi:hypothetical protein